MYCMAFLRCLLSLRIMFANFQGLPMFWHHVLIHVDHILITCEDQIIHWSVAMPCYVYLSANEYWDCLLSCGGWYDYPYATTCTAVGLSWLGAAGNEIIGTHAEKLQSDELCALMELHQQQPGNSTHLLYKHKRGQRAYLIPVGSLYREQSQAAAIWEEEAVVDTACTHCHHIYLGPGKTLPFPWIWTGFFLINMAVLMSIIHIHLLPTYMCEFHCGHLFSFLFIILIF